jgi:hypothetical protein
MREHGSKENGIGRARSPLPHSEITSHSEPASRVDLFQPPAKPAGESMYEFASNLVFSQFSVSSLTCLGRKGATR